MTLAGTNTIEFPKQSGGLESEIESNNPSIRKAPIDFLSRREDKRKQKGLKIPSRLPAKEAWQDHVRLFDANYQDRSYSEIMETVANAIPFQMEKEKDIILGIAHYTLILKGHIQDLKRARSYWRGRDIGYEAASNEFFNNGIDKHLMDNPWVLFGYCPPAKFLKALKSTMDAYGRDCTDLKDIQKSLEKSGKEKPDCLDALPAYMLANPRGFVDKAYSMLNQ